MAPGSSCTHLALVTGASRGIGRGIAVELARLGLDVIVNYANHRDAAEETQSEARASSPRPGSRIETCRGDVSVAADRESLVAFARERFGRLDLLVNNAGVAPLARVDLLEATEESFDRLIRINLKGPYFLTQLAARWMVDQVARPPCPDYRPAIVNITSVSAYAASPERGDYCVSKAGLAMTTQLYAVRLAEAGIKVYEVRPGVIATDMTAGVKAKYDALIDGGLTPIRRWGTTEDVARAVGAVATGRLPFSTGEVINVDGGFHIRRL
jgi:NAD(P)-dependent dehydrogenase (short-subunit alcohol dehydrogenase family)